MDRPLLFGLVLLSTGCVRAWLFDRLPQPLRGPEPAVAGLGSLSAGTCGACHTEIYAEWRGSMMAQAWTDPVFQRDWEQNDRLYACLYCHTPLDAQRAEHVDRLDDLTPLHGAGTPNPAFDAELQAEGVTCAACHLRDGALAGPHAVEQAPHPTIHDPDFASASRCEPCHQVAAPPLTRLRRPLSDTHGEWAAWQAQGNAESCVDCHMPAVERPLVAGGVVRAGRRHTFGGGWDDATVRASMSVAWEAGVLTLVNRAGHAVPTADPARAVEVTAAWADGRSDTRWIERSIRLPQLVETGDTSLTPGETRTYAFPGAASVRVVFHRLKNLPEMEPSSVVIFAEP